MGASPSKKKADIHENALANKDKNVVERRATVESQINPKKFDQNSSDNDAAHRKRPSSAKQPHLQATAPELYDSKRAVTFTKKPSGLLESFCDGRFVLRCKLGKGSFGVVYLGTDTVTNSTVAIKIERHRGRRTMTREIQILYNIGRVTEGVPKVVWSGDVGSRQIMCMSCLGRDLAGLFEACNRKFSLPTVLVLAEQMLCRIEEVHYCGYVHRDIKPHNFMTSRQALKPDMTQAEHEEYSKLYIIDFGLSATFLDNGNNHVGMLKGLQPVGTARYSSINNHRGIRQSRRDDLESIAHLLIYFQRGNLPWQSIKETDRVRKWRKIMWKKEDTPVESLCQGLEPCFEKFLRYCRTLRYNKQPDYEWARQMFRKCYLKHDFDKKRHVYDWDKN